MLRAAIEDQMAEYLVHHFAMRTAQAHCVRVSDGGGTGSEFPDSPGCGEHA